MNISRHLMLTLLLTCIACNAAGVPFIVNTTADNATTPIPGSLRDAINQVNADSFDAIYFNIPTSDAGFDPSTNTWTIAPFDELPTFSRTVTIDGYTQPGSSVNTLEQGDNAVLTIVLSGENVVSDGVFTGNGLNFLAGSDNSVIRGLVINGWALNGILINGGINGAINGIQVIGNFIGTDANASTSVPTRTGVAISAVFVFIGADNPNTNTIIGTANVADRNIFGGSFNFFGHDVYTARGACIYSGFNSGTVIVNNYIGIDRSGTKALGGTSTGIIFNAENFFTPETNSVIGGSTIAERNVISGCTIYGVYLTGNVFAFRGDLGSGCINCIIQGNYIGTDVTGTKPIANANAGISINNNAVNNSVLNNIISGNGTGIQLGQYDLPGSTNNIVQGNFFGTDASGTLPLSNAKYGIIVNDNQNSVGGSEIGQGNVISANGTGGMLIYGVNSTLVTGNNIGTDVSGTNSLPNKGNGIQLGAPGSIFCAGSNNIIGQ